MPPKKPKQQNKTVTIYNSKTSSVGNGKKEKKKNLYEQSRNNIDNWEFHFKSNELEEVKSILKCKDLAGVPLLIGAAVIDKKDIALNLIKHGYDVNEGDKHNLTPLYWAVKLNIFEMIRFFLINQADPLIKPTQGDDIIFLALGSNVWSEESFINLWSLVKNHVDFNVNAKNRNGVTMMHLSVRREWIDLLEILISNEANINASNSNGVTPFMLACYRNDYNIVDRLLKKGAALKRRNTEGFTALCYAMSSAIAKNLEPPFKVIDRIRTELSSRNNYLLLDYLKDRFKIWLNPMKKVNIQSNSEQMIKNIITFIGRYHEQGFEVLWKEIQASELIKESILKHIEDKDCIKTVLLILNTIVSHKPTDVLIANDLINSGCLNECVKVFEKYKDDNVMICNSFHPILFGNITQEKLLESNQQTLIEFSDRFLEILPDMGLHKEEHSRMQKLAEDVKLKLNLTSETSESCANANTVENVSSTTDVTTNLRKNKRRTKALKAKIAKLKTAELTERYNLYIKKSIADKEEILKEVNTEEKEKKERFVCDGYDFGEAVKGVISLLEDDDTDVADEKENDMDWKDIIRGKKSDDNSNKPWNVDIDLTIKYLEGILGVIVNKYKIIWETDKSFPAWMKSESAKIELKQSKEKKTLREIHRELYTLTHNVRQLFDKDPELSRKILKQLEKLLLSHSIRGETILDQVAAVETVKVYVTMAKDNNFDFAKYVQDVVNGEINENPDIRINSVKKVVQNCSDLHAKGDYVCVGEACRKKTGFVPSFSVFNSEDARNEFRPCCNKSCKQISNNTSEQIKDSRWCSLVKSIELMDDCQEFLNGSIRISNSQKRSNHLLSLNGNFAPLEIGLGANKRPLAVRFVLKCDKNAQLLKEEIDPILHLRHKNILHYHLCAYDSQHLIIATPLCEYNLGQFILKMKHTDMKICKIKMIRQFLTGILFLHSQTVPIVHGNLKPSNVLIDAYGNVRIAEFGIHQALLRLRTLPESTIIWFATETFKLYKDKQPIKCSFSSDIQVAGMLVHFALNNGSHPFGEDVDDILKNLEKAAPKILSIDLELCDLLTWMLLGEPGDRPTIHQVLSHIFFWPNSKKWRYIMTCAGVNVCGAPLDVSQLHSSLDKIAYKENIMSNCWVMTAKKKYPQAIFIDNNNDTASGLLKFIKFGFENNMFLGEDNAHSLGCFILNSFPHFALTLYRMIENTEWTNHVAFTGFHNVMNYQLLQ